jgi:type II secretory pathway component PulC
MNLETQLHQLRNQFNTPLIAGTLLLLALFGFGWSAWNTTQVIWLTQANNQNDAFRAPLHVNINQVASYHLMGGYTNNLKDLPLASLGVTLVGIFSDVNGPSTALIALSGGSSKLYHVGDQLAPNVKIEKILPHSLVVKHNGRLEKLMMPIQRLTFNAELPKSGLWGRASS